MKLSTLQQSNDAENAVIAALLIDRDAIYKVISTLQPNDFYSQVNKQIYQAIIDLYNDSTSIDLITVSQKLRTTSITPHDIVEITNKVVSSANVEYHARIVKQDSIKRQLLLSSLEVSKAAQDESVDCFDALEIAANNIQNIFDQVDKSKAEDKKTIADRIKERALNPPKGGITGLRFFGIDALDYKFGGLEKGELTIIAGRPSMGKSTLANTGFVHTGVHQNKPILYWSLEGSNDETYHRAVCCLADIDGAKIMKGEATEEEVEKYIEATEKIEQSACMFEDTSGVTASDIRMALTSRKRTHDIEAVILDHGGHIKYEGNGNRTNLIGDALKVIIQTAKELDIAIVLVWQLGRSVETRSASKRPALSDLRDSGELEQDAHKIAFVYRPEYYDIVETDDARSTKNLGEVIIAKNKNLGMSNVELTVDLPCFKFKSLDEKNKVSVDEIHDDWLEGIDDDTPMMTNRNDSNVPF